MPTRFLRSDATPLSPENVQDIINARGSMKYAVQVMAEKYHISPRRVYQIWRNDRPQIDNSYKAGGSSSKSPKVSPLLSVPIVKESEMTLKSNNHSTSK